MRVSTVAASVVMVVVAVVLIVTAAFGQDDKGRAIAFHVTSVTSRDVSSECENQCAATKFTVEGYSEGSGSSATIAYVLDCTEYTYASPKSTKLICERVHANTTYNARLYDCCI